MKQVSVSSLALAALSLGATLGWAAPAKAAEMGILSDEPAMPYDPSTIKGCTWWYDNDASVTCEEIPFVFGITKEQFEYWNPVAVGCKNFPTGKSYCVEGPAAPPVTTSQTPTTTTTAKPTTTTPLGNGVVTPTPTQEGMVSNCAKFDFVEGGTSCSAVLSRNGLTIAQLYAMNSGVGKDCSTMWADVYVCVALIGSSSTTAKPTTTKPGNGIATPTPIQDGMVTNCNKFYFVESGTSCSTVLSKNGLTIAQLYAMNPAVGKDCSTMWANVYVCVGTTSGTPTTTTSKTTTTKGNGISTPTPIQDGMVSNCDAFYFVKKGTSCSTVLSANGITLAQLYAWNPAVSKDCSTMWAEVYVCVSIVGHTPPTPTTTSKGNGVVTPTPTQTGMVGNCKTFHLVKTGDTCDTLAKKYGITVANFKKWNPAAGNDCLGLWKDTYACVGLL